MHTAVRDEYESKKTEYEQELSDILEVSWTIDIDPPGALAVCRADGGVNSQRIRSYH